jgi:[protein-PII] uridylyltransferase
LPEQHRDLYAAEPNVKEGAGGLRDYHAALWLMTVRFGVSSLDEAVGQSIITEEERLDLAEALDFVWRVRNELHFRAGKAEDRLTFKNQRAVAKAFGYPDDEHGGTTRLMEDYYGAARKIRRCLRKVARSCDYADAGNLLATPRPGVSELSVEEGELYAGLSDPQWFEENPARLMSVFWECARRGVILSHPSEQLIEKNLDLANDAFRSSDLVRRFFVAICKRPMQAGRALRQAANTGLLGRYLPEFAAVQDIVRYEDFHSYPVDEHTLRAIEALSYLDELEGPVARCLQKALENLPDPYILVMALLFHDLGKAAGEIHVQEGVALARQICERIGLPEDDRERIAFLVEHHLVMSEIGLYRDTDEESVVLSFARTMKSEDRLRALFLLTYADMSAVGPNVWNDWKGALLLKLYLRTEKVLLGRAQSSEADFWNSKKADEVRALAPADRRGGVETHLRDLGERYFIAFSPADIVRHMECLDEAAREGFAMRSERNDETNLSQVVVCTRDRSGLFAEITGCFASQLIDVNDSALFTRADGITLDCFTVANAVRRRPLTKTQEQAVEKVLRAVLLEGEEVETVLEQAQRRLFGLLQPSLAVPTRVDFDNDSSATHTVIDVQSGDRTGILYSMAKAIAECGLDIANARIVTDAQRVRDSFYVTMQGAKIEDKETQAHIAEAIRHAIHPAPAVEKGGSA